MLKGWKTYLAVAAGVATAGLEGLGYIDSGMAKTIETACILLGIGFHRAGAKRAEKERG